MLLHAPDGLNCTCYSRPQTGDRNAVRVFQWQVRTQLTAGDPPAASKGDCQQKVRSEVETGLNYSQRLGGEVFYIKNSSNKRTILQQKNTHVHNNQRKQWELIMLSKINESLKDKFPSSAATIT